MRRLAMLNLSEDISPLTDFKRNTSDFVRQMKSTKRPVVLTVNGKAELVVQDVESYQTILDRLDELETVEAIRLGMKDAAEGRVRPARKALNDLKKQLDLRR
jgi:prevent-host-death family protein